MALKIMKIIFNKIWKVLVCSKRMYGTHRQILGVLVACTLCLSFSLYFRISREYHGPGLGDTNKLVQKILKENIVQEKGTGCIMPDLDPFSLEVMKFVKEMPKVICRGTDWVECFKSECYLKKEILKNMTDVRCIYRDIIYVDDKLYFVADATKVYGDDKYTLNKSDHVKISCNGMDLNSLSIVYSRWYGYKAGFRPVQTRPLPPDRKDGYNVVMLGFDSASRNGFIRKMPKTYKYLVGKAVILKGYNIIGDGTPAALYPLLTGLAEEEHPDARIKIGKNKHVDARLFIFDLVKRFGYRTAYLEDMPWVGTFQYRFNGFRRQPADHYLRAFFMEQTKGGLRTKQGYPERHCIGATPQYQMMLNLAQEFLQLDGKKFGFTFIADITHDDFNVVATADEDVLSFLQNLTTTRAIDDTLVIVFGDHGPRFDTMRNTYQGKLEERLPLMAIMLPEKLKKLRPNALNALKHNQDVLTTPFDIHATLLDVLDLKDYTIKHQIPGSDLPRAMSLLEPIPKSRSCAEAGVMPHWCACAKWYNVSQSDPMYNQVAAVLAEYIDGISEEQRSKCEKRKLKSIEWVLNQNVNNQLLKYGSNKEMDRYLGNPRKSPPRSNKEIYQAKIVMSPDRGVYEGTLVYFPLVDSFTISQRDISRVNAYWDEPKCISNTHPHLSKFCYCKENLKIPRPSENSSDINNIHTPT